MSPRLLLRRVLVALVATLGLMAVPSTALGVSQSFSVTACSTGCFPMTAGFTSGGADSFTTSLTLDSTAGTPSMITTRLAAGTLVSLASATAADCISQASDLSTCVVGNGTVQGPGNTFTTYLVKPSDPAHDVAGLDLVGMAGTGHAELSLNQVTTGTNAGAIQGVITLPISGALFTGMTGLQVNTNGDLPDSSLFTRMPTSCNTPSPGSQVIVQYATAEATNASPDISIPAGSCTTPPKPYSPQLTASAQKDSGDSGVALQTTVTQAGNEAASFNSTLTVPEQALSPNTAAAPLLCTTYPTSVAGCTPVGSATVTTPLLPSGTTISGVVYLVGPNVAQANVAIRFPAPYQFDLLGAVNLLSNSLTFSSAAGGYNLPDVPLSTLSVNLKSSPELYSTTCAQPSATLTGSFTGQNGASSTSAAPFTIANCSSTPIAGKPGVASKSLGGLGKGKPKLSFTVTAGSNAPKLSTLKVKLPGGLKFAKKFKKGLKVSGGSLKSAKVQGGRLVITLSSPASSVTVTLGSKALKESKGLKKKVKKKKLKSLSVGVTATDASGTSTTLTLTFKKPH